MRQLLPALMLAGMGLLGAAGSAAAHNELIGSDPADGATVASSPARVALTFNQAVKPGFSNVIVTGPNQTQWQAGAAAEEGATVSMPIRPLELAGQYTIAYQVLSADGHPVRGAVRFTFAIPDTGAAMQSQSGASASNPPNPAAQNIGSTAQNTGARPEVASTPMWPWLVGGAVLLVAGATVALRISRRG